MLPQQVEVALVGLEAHVEEEADDGDGAQHRIRRDVEAHAGKNARRRAVAQRLAHHIERHAGAEQAADARNEAQQAVRAHGAAGAGNADGGVGEPGEPFEALHGALRREIDGDGWAGHRVHLPDCGAACAFKVEESDIAGVNCQRGPDPCAIMWRAARRQQAIGGTEHRKKSGVNGSNQKPFTPNWRRTSRTPRRNECSRLRMGGPKKTFALQHA